MYWVGRYRCVPGTVTTVSLILSCNKVLVLDGEMGALRGELGGGICGFEARSRALLKVDDIGANAYKTGQRRRSTVSGRPGGSEVSSATSVKLCIVDTHLKDRVHAFGVLGMRLNLWNWNVSDALPVLNALCCPPRDPSARVAICCFVNCIKLRLTDLLSFRIHP